MTTPTDVVGNAAFGATVQTFITAGIDPSTTCIENGLWTNPDNFALGDYVKGAEASGAGINNAVLGSYSIGGTAADSANGLDHKWVQDASAGVDLDPGAPFVLGSSPENGIIWDLGGQANQAAVFVFVDHGPVPQEVLENTAWLSNDANAAAGDWTQAFLTHVYGAGWEADPTISDGFVAVYTLPDPTQTFRFVSVTWGGPGAIQRDGDNEIDAVGGLTAEGQGVGGAPEPASLLLLGSGLAGLAMRRRHHA